MQKFSRKVSNVFRPTRMPEELIVELSHICVFVLFRMRVMIFPCLFFLNGERDTLRGNTIENQGCLFVGERVEQARQY